MTEWCKFGMNLLLLMINVKLREHIFVNLSGKAACHSGRLAMHPVVELFLIRLNISVNHYCCFNACNIKYCS